jgi:hypothetical protein
MFYVLIDTNAYEAYGNSFRGPLFEALINLVNAGKIKIFMSDVVKGEIESHLEDGVCRGINSLKKAMGDAHIFKADAGVLSPLLGMVTTEHRELKKQITQHRKDSLNTFIQAASIELLVSDNIDTAKILNDYFEKKPPFGEGKKKDEFPDAFALNKFISHVGDDSSNDLYIISNDDGWRDFSDSHDRLNAFDSIESFVDFVNQQEEELSQVLHEQIANVEAQLIDEFRRKLHSLDFQVGEEFIDPEIHFEDDEVDLSVEDIFLIEAGDDSAEWICQFNLNYTLNVSANDPDAYYKDDDTKEWICMGQNNHELQVSSSVSAIIETSFDREDIVNTFSVDDVNLPEHSVYISEDDYEVVSCSDWRMDDNEAEQEYLRSTQEAQPPT